MSPVPPKLPTGMAAWILTILGLLALAGAVWVSLPMLGPSGDGERLRLMLGLYVAIPLLVLSAVSLGICALKPRLKSSVSLWGFGLSIFGIAIWISLLVLLG